MFVRVTRRFKKTAWMEQSANASWDTSSWLLPSSWYALGLVSANDEFFCLGLPERIAQRLTEHSSSSPRPTPRQFHTASGGSPLRLAVEVQIEAHAREEMPRLKVEADTPRRRSFFKTPPPPSPSDIEPQPNSHAEAEVDEEMQSLLSAAPWRCSACTLINESTRITCGICSWRRSEPGNQEEEKPAAVEAAQDDMRRPSAEMEAELGTSQEGVAGCHRSDK